MLRMNEGYYNMKFVKLILDPACPYGDSAKSSTS
jgi:hypothetical protein